MTDNISCTNIDLDGSELRTLYLTNPEHDLLKSKQNIRKLLNFLVFHSSNSNEDMIILDYCVNTLKSENDINVQTKNEYYNKLMMEVETRVLEDTAHSSKQLEQSHLDNNRRKENRDILLTILKKQIKLEQIKKKKSFVEVTRKAAAVAALISICLFTTEMMTTATGQGVISYLADSIQNKFNIYFNEGVKNETLTSNYLDALEWVPEGFYLMDTQKLENTEQIFINYTYINNEGTEFNYTIAASFDGNTNTFSETNGTVDRIKIKGKTYFTYKNLDRNVILWQHSTAVYILESKLPKKTLITIIKKNFGE